MTECDAKAWASALGTEESAARISLTDYKLIWQLGSARRRGVEHRVVFWDYQSKTRGQFWFQEREVGVEGKWRDIRLHLQYMMEASDFEPAYPYIDFCRTEAVLEPSVQSWELILGEPPPVLLRNGDLVEGVNYMDEYFPYLFGAKLNDFGESLFESVTVLEQAGFIEITPGQPDWVRVAPWHGRSVWPSSNPGVTISVVIVMVRRAERGQTPQTPLGSDWDKKPRVSADSADAQHGQRAVLWPSAGQGRPSWMARDATSARSWASRTGQCPIGP